MRNKKMIIISITSIIIIALALIGITFGYYLTKITGNENNKSVSVESASKEVEIKEIETIETGVIKEGTTKIIEPGYENIKIFTVQNIGNTEATYHIYLDEVKNTFNRTQDITYTLYRKSGNNTIDTDNLSDSDIISTGTFPKNNSYIQVNETITTPNNYYTYALKVTYINSTTEDQTEDQGKTFSYKIQLHAEINLPKLADTIINNAKSGTNGTTYSPTPLTTPAEAISGETEKVLSVTIDDYGTSYYYRGGVEDNYVNFAGMCWRIVRIEGDGSTKLILEDKNTTCESSTYTGNWSLGTGNYGYDSTSGKYKMNYLNPVTNNTSSMVKAFYDFQTTALKDYTDKLKAGDWCLGDTAYSITGSSKSDYTYTLLTDTSSNYSSGTSFYYDAYARLTGNNKDGYNPSLKCNGTKLDKFATVTNVSEETSMYVSTLTADEVVYAGGKYGSSNQNYYLINEEFKEGYDGAIGSYYFWTLSPSVFNGNYDYAFDVNVDWDLSDDRVNYNVSLRPAVSLASSAKISSGEGTQSNPYVIE